VTWGQLGPRLTSDPQNHWPLLFGQQPGRFETLEQRRLARVLLPQSREAVPHFDLPPELLPEVRKVPEEAYCRLVIAGPFRRNQCIHLPPRVRLSLCQAREVLLASRRRLPLATHALTGLSLGLPPPARLRKPLARLYDYGHTSRLARKNASLAPGRSERLQ
jgi:hypothetical protein